MHGDRPQQPEQSVENGADNSSLVPQQMPSIEAPENLPVLILICLVSVRNISVARLSYRHPLPRAVAA